MKWLDAPLTVTALAVGALTCAGGTVSPAASQWPELGAFRASCLTDTPYFVTTQAPSSTSDRAVVAYRNACRGDPTVKPLAHADVVGTVYGLAVDALRGDVYAAALWHEFRSGTFSPSPGGLGAIYRIDLESGAAGLWATVDAASPSAEGWTSSGKAGLGDLEFDRESNSVVAANLRDRTIVRLSVPDGRMLDTFAHGAAAEAWAPNARIFGLGVKDGWLYHGVVDSREDRSLPGSLAGYVFRSRVDGSEMTEVVRFDLGYPHTPSWKAWTDTEVREGDLGGQPLIVDIAPRANGDLIIGLRDRANFLDYQLSSSFSMGDASGDLLLADCQSVSCVVVMKPRYSGLGNQLLGSLAVHPGRDWMVVRVGHEQSGGAMWLDVATGAPLPEGHCQRTYVEIDGEQPPGGDVEALCDHTVVQDTVYLPLTQQVPATCTPEKATVVLILDMSTTMREPTESGTPRVDVVLTAVRSLVGRIGLAPDDDGFANHVGIVAFNDTAWLEQVPTDQAYDLWTAIDRLRGKMAEGSRIDLGLGEATRSFDRAQGKGPGPAAPRVGVLVTDGIPNRVPPAADGSVETTILEAARAFEMNADDLVVVGIGSDAGLNHRLLRAVASDPTAYYWTTRADDLERLFADIARRVTCR